MPAAHLRNLDVKPRINFPYGGRSCDAVSSSCTLSCIAEVELKLLINFHGSLNGKIRKHPIS